MRVEPGNEDLPVFDFTTFVLSLIHSANVHLGLVVDPATLKTALDLTMARQTIDLLGMLEEKTRGNLSGEEERILEQALFELRMRFVEVNQKT